MATDENELFHFDNINNRQNRLISIDSFDYDDTSSVVNTSDSGSRSKESNSRTKEINSRPRYDSIEPPKPFIGRTSIEDSRNVLFGTIFRPVVIRNLITVRNDVTHNANTQSDQLKKVGVEQTFRTSYRTRRNRVASYFGDKRRLIVLILASAVVLVAEIIVVKHYLHLTDDYENEENIRNPERNPSIETTKNIDYGLNDGGYKFIVRQQYGALPPKTVFEPLKLPIRRLIVGHTATPNCKDYSECAFGIRQMQHYHMNLGWGDIGYNFLVGGDGRAYEGRGYRVGAHTKNFNEDSLCITFIGDFTLVEAPKKQLRAAQRLIIDGIKMSQIHPDYMLYGQRQIKNASNAIRNSPGIMLYNQITLWPHWSKEIIPLT